MSQGKHNIFEMAVVNLDLERKKELDRRKKLRLLQVRQQSKDFASRQREKIHEEMKNEKNKFLESHRNWLKEQRLKHLNQLKEKYQTEIQIVGESYREAAKQPSINQLKEAEIAQNISKAAFRGVNARKQQQEKEALQREKIEGPVKNKKIVRNRENLRSFYISSLPKCGPRSENNLMPLKTTIPRSEASETQVLQEIPSNLLNLQQPKTDQRPIQEHDTKRKISVQSQTRLVFNDDGFLDSTLPKECPCDYVVCCCHGSPRSLRKRSHSDSRSSIEKSSESELVVKKVKTRSRSCSPRSVRTLNYCDAGNLYESNQPSYVRVTHHPSPSKTKEDRASKTVGESSSPKKVDHDALRTLAEERGAKALKREQLKKDFEQLLKELTNLNRKKLQRPITKTIRIQGEVYQTDRDITAKKVTKQKRLHDAFETLIYSAKSKQHQNTGSVQGIPQSEIDLSSPPSINLAVCQEIMSRGSSPTRPMVIRRVISSEEITVSQTSIPEGVTNKSPPRRSPQSSGRSPTQSSSRKSPSPSSKTPTTSSKPPPYSDPPTESTDRIQSSERFSPEVSVRSDATAGEVHVTVRVNPATEPRKHKKKCKRVQLSSSGSSTSYYDPPENLSPSQERILNDLLKQVNKKALNQDLKKYIKKLLTMSRESIDNLDALTAPGQIDPMRSPTGHTSGVNEDIAKLSDLTELYVDKVNTLVDILEEIQQIDSPENPFASSYIAPPSTLQTERRVYPPTRIPTPITPQAPHSREPSPSQVPSHRRQPSPFRHLVQGSYRRDPSLAQRPGGQPTPMQDPSATMARHYPQPPAGQSRTPSPAQRVPHRPTTPPMQSRSRRPVTPMPPDHAVGPPPDSAGSRIPVSPRYQSPQRPPSPQQPKVGLASIQTPYGLSANLLPHPREVFGQPHPDPQPGRGFTTQQTPHLTPVSRSPQRQVSPSQVPRSPGKINVDDSTDSWDPFEGLPRPPPTPPPGTRQRDVMSILRDYRPDMSTIVTDSSFDLSAELEKHGLAEDFKHLRKPKEPVGGTQSEERSRTESHPNRRRDQSDEREEFQPVDFESSSFSLESIRRRLSDVCNEHYVKISEWLRSEPDLEQDRFIREVLESDKRTFDEGSQTARSLALKQALRIDP